jgi:hypothetical protein
MATIYGWNSENGWDIHPTNPNQQPYKQDRKCSFGKKKKNNYTTLTTKPHNTAA